MGPSWHRSLVGDPWSTETGGVAVIEEEVQAKLEAAGHVLARDDNENIDWYVMDHEDKSGRHHGPACVYCQARWCVFCTEMLAVIEPCVPMNLGGMY